MEIRDSSLNPIMYIYRLDVRFVLKDRTSFDSRHRIDLVLADYVRTCHGNDRIMACVAKCLGSEGPDLSRRRVPSS